MKLLKKIYTFSLLLLIASVAAAQDTDISFTPDSNMAAVMRDSSAYIQVKHIYVSGNKKTRSHIIFREIQFEPGDSILASTLPEALQLARQQVYNTSLFHQVQMEARALSSNAIDVYVTVKERWYIFPLPQFQLVDRNLNEWLVTYKADLSRVNYGIKFSHYNLTGRKDPLRIYLLNGFTRNISFSYSQPYINMAMIKGGFIGAGYTESRQMAYSTSYENKLLVYNTGNFILKTFFANAGLVIRRSIKNRHVFSLAYTHVQVADSVIARYNPDYFKSDRASKGFTDINYSYQHADVNNINYPLKGTTGFISLSKRGLQLKGGINMFSVEAGYNKYWDIGHRWYGALQVAGRIKFPFNQAYINQRALGYGEAYLRGLEYQVIDGVAWGIIKPTLKKKLFSFSIPLPFKSKTYPSIPFIIFAKTFADIGYCYSKQYNSMLNNRLLYTGGVGIDILSLYDINFRVEYSFNQLGQNGLFLHTQGGF